MTKKVASRVRSLNDLLDQVHWGTATKKHVAGQDAELLASIVNGTLGLCAPLYKSAATPEEKRAAVRVGLFGLIHFAVHAECGRFQISDEMLEPVRDLLDALGDLDHGAPPAWLEREHGLREHSTRAQERFRLGCLRAAECLKRSGYAVCKADAEVARRVHGTGDQIGLLMGRHTVRNWRTEHNSRMANDRRYFVTEKRWWEAFNKEIDEIIQSYAAQCENDGLPQHLDRAWAYGELAEGLLDDLASGRINAT